jgi:hypothetical protein
MKAVSKPDKILTVMFDLSGAEPKALLYEDIVVAAFRRYPEDFQLRGYPEYPDSSDIHKPLYKMKRDGLVRSANKSFMLTPMGIGVAQKLTGTPDATRDRLTKPEENEITRITKSQAFQLFLEDQKGRILDTDFYDYLGVSVRTPKGDFLGRLATVAQAVAAHGSKRNDKLSEVLAQLHEWITVQFDQEIQARK